MREPIKDFVKVVSQTIPLQEVIYEFGSYQVVGQEGYADLRVFFPGKKYIGADMRPGPGVDQVLDLHNIDLPSNSVQTLLLLDTLEHVEYPNRAMEEVYRVLAPDGVAVISSVMNFQIHLHPNDFWRFTPSAFESLLKPFKTSVADFAGEAKFPHTVVGIGFKGESPALDAFHAQLAKWKKYHSTLRGKAFIRQFIPPIVIKYYDKALGKG